MKTLTYRVAADGVGDGLDGGGGDVGHEETQNIHPEARLFQDSRLAAPFLHRPVSLHYPQVAPQTLHAWGRLWRGEKTGGIKVGRGRGEIKESEGG